MLPPLGSYRSFHRRTGDLGHSQRLIPPRHYEAHSEVGFAQLPEPAYPPETQAGQNGNHGDDHMGHPDGMSVAASRVKQARREQGNDEQ
jgi:hypothetical protein